MIVKVTSYTKIRKAAKATIRYIMHRPNERGERVTRGLFGSDGLMERYHGYWMIDDAPKGSTFYRVALSPDPNKEDADKDLDLEWMTLVAMRSMKEKLEKDAQFVAAVHDDQTAVRHVNALVVMPGRLSKKDFREFPQLLKRAALAEVRLQRQTMDPEPEQTLSVQTDRFVPSSFQTESTNVRFSKLPPILHTCPSCGPTQSLWKIADDQYKCPSCGTRYEEMGYSGG